MPEVKLYGSGVLRIVCEFIAGSMAEHVRVNREGEADPNRPFEPR